MTAFASAGVAPAAKTSHVYDAVRAYQSAHPGEAVPVIVQTDGVTDPAQLVRAAGGAVRTDLGFMQAVAADLAPSTIERLGYDARVRGISLDATVSRTDENAPVARDGSSTANAYPQEIHADRFWRLGLMGQGIGVAVVDTGIAPSKDFGPPNGPSRVVASVSSTSSSVPDGYGHGTHVAGLIGGNGLNSNFRYTGVAPRVNLIDVKTGDDEGNAHVSDVIFGLSWVLDHKDEYNIRVVNLSLRSDIAQSYTTDPLDAAVELLTFRGILVVVAAGNTGSAPDAVSYAPGNDPYVLSVGAVDDHGTDDSRDDTVPSWSSRGITQDGFAKPEVYTPGRRLVSVLSPDSVLATENPGNIVDSSYFQLSGTSMAAGVASGGAALIFQAHPDWTPGQVKLALIRGAARLSTNPYARIVQLDQTTMMRAPVDTTTNVKPSFILLQAAGIADPQSISWGSISWGSISWGSISWGSISWGSVSWGSVSWGQVDD
jgi:serine protease AprX